ncbi:MAG: ornithine carbamoyltransferase [Burkholderiales bacterium]|nr:ornithine carbamoyltransferase [Burkholderiales bacterium]
MKLLHLSDLSAAQLRALWRSVGTEAAPLAGTVGWSFEGNGVRTRTSFLQAFHALGLSVIELPNLLKTAERPCDLAGYLDPFYTLYVLRESDHARLQAFAAASTRPVINAMSGVGHPCEVLSDAYFVDAELMPIHTARICLWGPPTNVLRSWHELAGVLGLQLRHVCEARWHTAVPGVRFCEASDEPADLVITDAWPADAEWPAGTLTLAQLERLGRPRLLPTPPFSIGRELGFDPLGYAGFVGYQQKRWLLPVQQAIVRFVLGAEGATP